MKKIIAVAVVAASLAGCGKSEYMFNEVEILPGPNGYEGNPKAFYVEKKSGNAVTGTIKKMAGDKVVLQFNVKDGKVVGDWQEFTQDGHPKVTGKVENQAWVGEWKSYCAGEQQDTASIVRLAEGNRTVSKTFDCATGLQANESAFITDEQGRVRKVGTEREWLIKDGKQIPTRMETYAEDGSGQLEGISEKYSVIGQLVERANYKSGQLNGTYETWYAYKDGGTQLKSRVNYANSRKDGESITYREKPWPDGTVEIKESYKDGVADGIVISYSDSAVHAFGKSENNRQIESLVNAARSSVVDLDSFDYLFKNSGIDIGDKLGTNGPLIVVAGENAYSLLVGKYGADVNGSDATGKTRLDACFEFNTIACSYEHMMVLAQKQDLKHKDGYNRQPLGNFCRNVGLVIDRLGADKAIKLADALVKGSDINNRDLDGQTALHGCMQSRNQELISKLTAAGADLNLADYEGTTPPQMLFFTHYRVGGEKNVAWSPEVVKLAASYQGESTYRLNQPLATFNRSIKDLMLENGDAANAKLVDSLEKRS